MKTRAGENARYRVTESNREEKFLGSAPKKKTPRRRAEVRRH
jgi:hypothetical protein